MPEFENEIFTLNRAPCSISLEDEKVSIRLLPKPKDENDNKSSTTRKIKLSEILSVRCCKGDVVEGKKKAIFSPKKKAAFLGIYTFKRCKDHKWKLITIKLKSDHESVCEKWVQLIREKLMFYQICRPKSLLVFVNPHGGRGIAEEVYEKKAESIFEVANIRTCVIVTEHRYHARKYIETEDISDFDGIVAVGGDGILNEVANGLICRTQSQRGIDVNASKGSPRECPKYVRPDIRVGIIPAGSTDCVSYVTNGINDAETSAIHIAIGDSHPIDVTSLHNVDGLFQQFSLSLTGYGFYGDTLRKSENFRWMGPPRYSYVGVNTFLQNRSYSGEVHYLPGNSIEGPKSDSFCRAPCHVCQHGFDDDDATLFTPVSPNKNFMSVETSPASLSLEFEGTEDATDEIDATENAIMVSKSAVTLTPNYDMVDDSDATNDKNVTVTLESDNHATDLESVTPTHGTIINAAHQCHASGSSEDVTDSKTAATAAGNGLSDSREVDENASTDGIISFSVAPRPSTLNVAPPLENPQKEESPRSDEEWKVLRGDFIIVNAVPITCACERSPYGLSPSSHLADGELDLITVRSCSRVQFLRYLLAHTNRGDRFDFPFVEVRRVKAFQFIPTTPFGTVGSTVAESPNGSNGPDSVQISLDEMSVKYNRSGKKKKREGPKRSQSLNDALSTWNSDGEIVRDANLTVRVHRGLMLMFCRGVEDV